MKTLISPAREEDLFLIQKILKENDLPYSDLQEENLSTFLVIRTDNDLIATIGTEIYQPDALLRSLAVMPAYRNKGYAAGLVAAIENFLITRGVQSLYLLTTSAEKYFTRIGYTVSDRKKVPETISATNEFKTLCPDSAVCMVKHLNMT